MSRGDHLLGYSSAPAFKMQTSSPDPVSFLTIPSAVHGHYTTRPTSAAHHFSGWLSHLPSPCTSPGCPSEANSADLKPVLCIQEMVLCTIVHPMHDSRKRGKINFTSLGGCYFLSKLLFSVKANSQLPQPCRQFPFQTLYR